jgi:hypothetical protein
MSIGNELYAPGAEGQWGSDNRCPEATAIRGADGAESYLFCDLWENHPEIHWDTVQEVVWTGWTAEQEAENNRR